MTTPISDWQRSPTLQQVLERLRKSIFAGLRVSLPAVVQAYDPSTQTVDAHPQIQDSVQMEDGSVQPLPWEVVPHVPVAFPSGGGFRLTFPIQPGDTGLLVFADRGIDLWQQQGGEGSPVDDRRHHLSDAIFVPGVHPDNAAWSGASVSAITLGKDGGPQIVARSGTIELGGSDLVPPVNAAVLGTVYRAAEDSLFIALGTALAGAGAGLASAGADPTFQPAFPAAAGFLAAAGAALNAFAAALTAFTAAEAGYLSTIVKTG